MLEVKKLQVEYIQAGKPAEIIHDLTFSLPKDGVLAVIGPSGCGKTTLLNTLAGIMEPTAGEVLFHGKRLSPKNTKIGLIPQNYGLLPWKTVKSNCLFCVGNKKENEEKVKDFLERLGIKELINRYPGEISGGQAQRVALAKAFLMEPELVLMDEPFTALDYVAAHDARELTFQMWREHKSTAVIVTHGLEEALYLSSYIGVLGKNGKFVFLGENKWQGKKETNCLEYYGEIQKLQEMLLRLKC